MEHRRQFCIENPLSAQVKLPHPAQALQNSFGRRLHQTNRWIFEKPLGPIQCLRHGERWTESARISNDVEKFTDDERRENNLAAVLTSDCTAETVRALAG